MSIKLWAIWQTLKITKNPKLVMASVSAMTNPIIKLWNYRLYLAGQSVPGWLFEVSQRSVIIPKSDYTARFLQPTVIIKDLVCNRVSPLTGNGDYVDVIRIECSDRTKDWSTGLVVTFQRTRLITRPVFQWWQLYLVGMFSILSIITIRLW